MSHRPGTTRFGATQPSTPSQAAEPPAGRRGSRPVTSRPLRFAAFAVIVLVIGGAAIGLVVSRLQGPGATDTEAVQVHASMGGSIRRR